ncbi:PhoH family protein [Zavarzinia sp. CC-PAN008]|uniref:PhoH family protein n=1 Tax=Zavarzinia sp. CC-PAN008 TaxID=3243332 RepID=UPI003F7486EB
MSDPDPAGGSTPGAVIIEFPDSRALPRLFGEHDVNLARIERRLGVHLSSRGNRLSLSGPADRTAIARAVLDALYQRAEAGNELGPGEVDGAIRLAEAPDWDEQAAGGLAIKTARRLIRPRSPGQSAYLHALQRNEMVFGIGPAGTGKTYLAVAKGVSLLLERKVERLVLSRPAVEAGERLGFLPGDLKDKVDPYLRPLYDALHDMLPAEQVQRRLDSGEIEVAPLAFMRGRTLAHAYVILDEAQNTTPVQMRMFLTRLGENARMVIAGDPSQVDLPPGTRSGLVDALGTVEGVDGIGVVRFAERDVVRHHLVARIVEAYNRRDAAERLAR